MANNEEPEASTTAMATRYGTSASTTATTTTNNGNNNEVIASDIADVSVAFGQQSPAVEASCRPRETVIMHTVGLDREAPTSTSSNGVAVTPKNAITTGVAAVDIMKPSEEGLLSNNGVANICETANHANKYNNNAVINNSKSNNNNNHIPNNGYCNNNSHSNVVGSRSDASADVENEAIIARHDPQRTIADPSSPHQILPTSTTSPVTKEAFPSSKETTAEDETTDIPSRRSLENASNSASSLTPYCASSSPVSFSSSSSSSSPSAGPAEAPTTRSTPTRRSTPIPSLELQPEVTFQQLQRERQACTNGTPNTTPTSAVMRTPPSPRATSVILPLPRVTVTSPSDLSPPCNGSNTTLTMDEEETVAHSPPSPQSPTSPTIPLTPPPTPPPPRSVVIVPMTMNSVLTTVNGMIGIGVNDLPQDMINMPPPPPYEGLVKADDSTTRHSATYGLSHMDTLPSYAVATDLPTYEEAERAKANEMRDNPLSGIPNREATTASHLSNSTQQSGGSRSGHPDDDRVPTYDPYHLTGVSMGTDWIFLCTFAISFLFNWLGFLISLCITNTVAGRCGALSGLGLSMVKWVVIMKHNTMAQGFLQGDSWVWWILMVCGFLLFLRGCIQYVNMKYEWKRIFSRLQQMYFS